MIAGNCRPENGHRCKTLLQTSRCNYLFYDETILTKQVKITRLSYLYTFNCALYIIYNPATPSKPLSRSALRSSTFSTPTLNLNSALSHPMSVIALHSIKLSTPPKLVA